MKYLSNLAVLLNFLFQHFVFITTISFIFEVWEILIVIFHTIANFHQVLLLLFSNALDKIEPLLIFALVHLAFDQFSLWDYQFIWESNPISYALWSPCLLIILVIFIFTASLDNLLQEIRLWNSFCESVHLSFE